MQVYFDNQNIQESIFNSIVNIIYDYIINDNTQRLLLEYCDNKDIHSKTQLTFEDLLCNVWILINTLDTKDEIKNILNIEINYSKCLNGFTDLVKINITDNQQI